MGIEFKGLPQCDKTSKAGEYCHHLVGNLSPTQSAVGIDEVEVKTKDLASRKEKKLEEYLYLRPVPVIIGRRMSDDGEFGDDPAFYLIDHHHLARAYWQIARDPEKNKGGVDEAGANLVVKVVENWYHIGSPKRFWKAMDKANWVYPFDDGGGGPHNVIKLPAHVKDLTNDPYRSLAWYVRKRFGYFKDAANPIFAEFKWANFFRTRVELGDALLDPRSGKDLREIKLREIEKDSQSEFEAIVNYAVALARSGQARELPGYFLNA